MFPNLFYVLDEKISCRKTNNIPALNLFNVSDKKISCSRYKKVDKFE